MTDLIGVSWTGATPEVVDPFKATITMDADKTATAIFRLDACVLTLTSPNGSKLACSRMGLSLLPGRSPGLSSVKGTRSFMENWCET